MITSYNDERFEEFKKDINSIWIKKLIREFHKQNRLIYKVLNKELKDPNFIINYPKDIWGSWNASTNTVSLSYSLFENYEWDAVVQTLKHEMAHMIVSEIWHDVNDNGNDHGELFKKACLILDVDSQRCHSSFDKANYRIPEKEKIVSKIHKLFCLGESNHKAEAEAAVAKAHELMLKYNVSSVERPSNERVFVCRPVGKIYNKVPEYVKILARVVAKNYFVKRIFMYFGSGNGYHRTTSKRYIEFYGEPHNVDIAEYVFHFLLNEGERQWKEFTKTDTYKERHNACDYIESYSPKTGQFVQRKKMVYSKMAFLEGFVSGFSATIEKKTHDASENVDPNNKLPISISDPLLDEKYKKEYNPTTWRSCGGSSGAGRSNGRIAGSTVTIRQGIQRGSQTGSVGAERMALTA